MNLATPENKVEINRRMIGKTVKVLAESGNNWIGEVTDAKGEDYVTVTNTSGDSFQVDIWNIRSLN